MRKTIFTMLIVFFFFLGFAGVYPAESQYDECSGPSVAFDKSSGWKAENALRGKGQMRDAKNILLFTVDVRYYSKCGDPAGPNAYVLREFKLVLDTNIPASYWQNVWLVLDDNANLRAEPYEKRFPMIVDEKTLSAVNLDIRLPYSETKTLIVIADFREIRDNDSVALRLEYGMDLFKIEPAERNSSRGNVFLSFINRIQHWRGNKSPGLFFVWQSPYSSKYAVFPRAGSPQEEYEFAVYYQDEDGDKPTRAEVWIDENGNGEFERTERFPMVDQKPEITFHEPHPFRFKKSFSGLDRKGVKFKFYFADADGPAAKGTLAVATGLEPATVFEIQFNHNIMVWVGEIRKDGYLPGEIIPVKLGVLVYFQGAIEIDWKDFRQSANLKHFAFKGLSAGERRIFDDLYDIEEATVFLEAPSIRTEKKYVVDLPALPFVAKVDGRTGKIGVPRFEISVTLKSRVEGPFVDQLLVRVGEPITYRVKSVYLADAPRLQELEKLTFKPFVEVGRVIKTTRNKDLVIEDFVFTLMLFEVKGEYKIPAFKFPFGRLAGFNVTLLPSKGAEKLALPYNERGLRIIPASSQRMAGKTLFAASVLVLVVLLRRPFWRGLRLLARLRSGRTWQDRVRQAYNSVREAVTLAQANSCRETLYTLYDRIRFYFIVVADAADIGKFAGADGRTLQKALAGSVDRALLDAFIELEDILMSSVGFDAGEILAKLHKLDQTTQAMYSQLN